MKRIFGTMCVCLALVNGNYNYAQKTIMAYPVQAIGQVACIGYEYHAPETRLSFGVLASGYFYTTPGNYIGFSISPYMKIAFDKDNIPNSWYFQNKLIIGHVKGQEEYYYVTVGKQIPGYFPMDFGIYGGGITVGKQWTLKNGLTFSIDVGLKCIYKDIPNPPVKPGSIDLYHKKAWYFSTLTDLHTLFGCVADANFGIGYTFPVKNKQ